MHAVIGSGIIVMGILIVRKLAMGKITRKLQYSVWLILPIFLLLSSSFYIGIPIHLEKNVSTKYESEQKEAGINKNDEIVLDDINPYFVNYNNTVDFGLEMPSQSEKNRHTSYSVNEIWKVVKYTVTFFLLIFYIVNNVSFAICLFQNRRFYKKDEQTNLNIYLLNQHNTPFLFGKSIYLHDEMANDSVQMQYMILHEFCHYKQGDLLWNIIKYVCCAVCWFNPFVWLAAHFVSRDCELACDEAVINLIGHEKRSEYGMTLLHLIRERKNRNKITIGTAMSGKNSMMRERILLLSKTFHRSRWSTVIFLIGTFALCGCSLIHPYISADHIQIVEEEDESNTEASFKISEDQIEISNASVFNAENNCYNSMKYSGDTLYYTSSGNLYGLNVKTNETEQLIEGNINLGNIYEGYLYYIKYPVKSVQEAGIGRVDLKTSEEQIVLPWKEEYWSCVNILAQKGCLYLEIGNSCEAYSLEEGEAVRIDETENIISNAIEKFDLSLEKAYGINYCYINSIIDYSTFTLLNSGSHELYICNAKTGGVIKKENCQGNVLISKEGIIYTTLAGDIILSSWEHIEDDQLIFSVDAMGYQVNYGTYNERGLYVFRETGEAVECKCITWEGEIKDMMEIPDTRLAIGLEFSAFSEIVAYGSGGKINVFRS